MRIDFWNNDGTISLKDVYGIDCSFSDIDCIYRGNLYNKNGKMIGDYSTTDSIEITETFKFFKFD